MPVPSEGGLLGYDSPAVAELDVGETMVAAHAVVDKDVVQLDVGVHHAVLVKQAQDLEDAPGHLLDLGARQTLLVRLG